MPTSPKMYAEWSRHDYLRNEWLNEPMNEEFFKSLRILHK